MAIDREDHVEVTPQEARQGGLGRHLLVILTISTLLAVLVLGLFFAGSAGLT